MKILVNAIGISDSGGARVLEKFINESSKENNDLKLHILLSSTNLMKYFSKNTKKNSNLKFQYIKLNNFFIRLIYENFYFRKIIQKLEIDLIYNFSGTSQFFIKKPQLIKMQNLLFYSKKLNQIYLEKFNFFKWLKHIYFKAFIFQTMLKKSSNIEIQSIHVKSYVSDFVELKDKKVFIKSDINISENEFLPIKNYDFSKKIKFLYIVGPHFEFPHKNFSDFVNSMLIISRSKLNFEINITLSKQQLTKSKYWNNSLNSYTNFYGYIDESIELKKLFTDNTILISTSVIETLGLHVIEAIKNGIISVVPDEDYARAVYGEDMYFYDLFDINSLAGTIISFIKTHNSPSDKIKKQQAYLITNESKKHNNMNLIFTEINNV